MELSESTQNNVRILQLAGRFDTYTAPPIREWLADAISQSTIPQLVVNLSGVNFVDSTAMATLVQGMKRCREVEGDLRLCHLQQPVRMIFELTRLDRAFEIFNAEEEAVLAFSDPQ
jgi:anti-sigma B factor antagonist